MRTLLIKIRTLLTKKRVITIAVILAVIAFWRFSVARKNGIQVTVSEVKKGKIMNSISASGEVTAEKLANMTFPISGKLAWLNITDGQAVKKYQALASLDKTPLDATYQQAQSMVRKYEATVENVHDQVKNHSADETFAQKDTRTTAEATKDYYWDALRVAQYNLDNATLIAPFDGIVSNFASGIAVGANVTAAVTIFSVSDPTTVYFKSEVDETEVAKIKPNQKVLLELDAYPGEIFEGKIKSVGFASIVNSTGGTAYNVAVTLPQNKELKFRLGMNGDAKFIVNEKEDVLLVSQSAIVEMDDGKNYVWVVNGGNKANKKEVKLGISSTDEVEILEGLTAGEKVIEGPSAKIKAGVKVKYN